MYSHYWNLGHGESLIIMGREKRRKEKAENFPRSVFITANTMLYCLEIEK